MKIVSGLPALETIDVKRNYLENVMRRALEGTVIPNIDPRTLMILSVEGAKMFDEWLEEQVAEAYALGYEAHCKDVEELKKL